MPGCAYPGHPLVPGYTSATALLPAGSPGTPRRVSVASLAVGLSSAQPLIRLMARSLCVQCIAEWPARSLTIEVGRPGIHVLDFLGPLDTRGVQHVLDPVHSVEYVLYFISQRKPIAVI